MQNWVPPAVEMLLSVPHVVPVVNPERFKVQGEKIHHFPEQKSHLRPYKQPKNTSETWLVCEPTWTVGPLFGERHPRGEDFELNNNVGERRSQWFFMIVFSQKWQAPGNTGFKILQGFFQDIFHTTTLSIQCCFFLWTVKAPIEATSTYSNWMLWVDIGPANTFYSCTPTRPFPPPTLIIRVIKIRYDDISFCCQRKNNLWNQHASSKFKQIHLNWRVLLWPRQSMYGIFTYIWLIFMVDIGRYTIHWVFGWVESNTSRKNEKTSWPEITSNLIKWKKKGCHWKPQNFHTLRTRWLNLDLRLKKCLEKVNKTKKTTWWFVCWWFTMVASAKHHLGYPRMHF